MPSPPTSPPTSGPLAFVVEKSRKRDRECKACGRLVRSVVVGRRKGAWTGTQVCIPCLTRMAQAAMDGLPEGWVREVSARRVARSAGRFLFDLLGIGDVAEDYRRSR